MDNTPTMELGTGLFVLLGFAALFFLATQTTNLDDYLSGSVYRVTARFDEISGLKEQAPVTMAGVTIGRVESIEVDPEILDAIVTMRISSDFNRIPDDTDASILTAGLLGTKYIGLGPGASDTYLGDASQIDLTQSAVVLEELVGKYLFSQGEEQ
jgi:phospholipid/cholesterol/gamma-HCH transport system substrate-binding protein